MGTKKTVTQGDIIVVPLAENAVVIGIVLHVSLVFKNSMIIGFYDRVFESIENIDLNTLNIGLVDTPNYTSIRLVTSGRWNVIANRQDLLSLIEVPLLRASNTIYYKDEIVKYIRLEEFNNYTELTGQGGVSVENKLKRHFSNSGKYRLE